MKRHIFILLTAMFITAPAMADEAQVNAGASVQAESDTGFFSSAWGGIKGFFGFDGDAEEDAQPAPQAKPDEPGMIDKAAASTKAGVDWTADKAKKTAEWTKETAVDVKDDAVGGAKAVGSAVGEGAAKVGGAIKGALSSDAEVEVEAEASAESQ